MEDLCWFGGTPFLGTSICKPCHIMFIICSRRVQSYVSETRPGKSGWEPCSSLPGSRLGERMSDSSFSKPKPKNWDFGEQKIRMKSVVYSNVIINSGPEIY